MPLGITLGILQHAPRDNPRDTPACPPYTYVRIYIYVRYTIYKVNKMHLKVGLDSVNNLIVTFIRDTQYKVNTNVHT